MKKVYGLNDGIWHPDMEKHFTHEAVVSEIKEIVPDLFPRCKDPYHFVGSVAREIYSKCPSCSNRDLWISAL